MIYYIYKYYGDVISNIEGCTGLTPSQITSDDIISINFESALSEYDKSNLDEFMSTRGYFFDRQE